MVVEDVGSSNRDEKLEVMGNDDEESLEGKG